MNISDNKNHLVTYNSQTILIKKKRKKKKKELQCQTHVSELLWEENKREIRNMFVDFFLLPTNQFVRGDARTNHNMKHELSNIYTSIMCNIYDL